MIHDQDRFRRHAGACPFYRENWFASEDVISVDDELKLYEIYCLRETPPETIDEQQSCMLAETNCWRDGLSHKTVVRRERRAARQMAGLVASS